MTTVVFNPQVHRILPGRIHDAFGRLPVSSPTTLADYQNQYDANPLLWDTVLTGTGSATHEPATASVALTVSANGDRVVRQTRHYHRYQPGKSQLIFITGDFLSAGSLYIVRRSKTTGSVVDDAVGQSDWNINDFLGTGKDWGFTAQQEFAATKAQIFSIDMEWLGVGSVRTGFVIDGVWQGAHVFHHANLGNRVYMTTANLPLRYEISQAGGVVTRRMGYFDDDNGIFLHHQTAANGGTLAAICGTVISEGGFEADRGYPFAASNLATTISVTTRRPILSIRPKATFNSIVNRGRILLDSMQVYAGNSAAVELIYGGTLTGASFASVNNNSIVEYDVDATAISGGALIDATIVPSSSSTRGAQQVSVNGQLPLTLDAVGANPINLSIVATALSTAAACSGVLSWTENR